MTLVRCVIIVTCFAIEAFALIDYGNVEREVELQCIQHCPLQNRTDLGHYDYVCDYDCNISQCSKGCTLWTSALSSTCPKACNGTTERLSHRELYCVIGCNDAIGKYFGQIRNLLGVPPAPALLDNSLTSTTLKLEWRFPEASRARLSCHVQWRYEEIVATWQYCRNATWNIDTSDFLVNGLQPYTKYRFRIALNLGHGHGDPIFSEQSLVIATLAAGVPASPPMHVRAAPVDAHSVSVSWEPGPFPHGPLLSYVLQITDNHDNNRTTMEERRQTRSEVKDVSSTSSFYVYRNLQPNTNYEVSVQMRNSYGAGPAATVQVTTPRELEISENQQPILILGTQYGIFELESLFGDSLHLFHSDETAIEGISIHIGKQLLFVSDANGTVWRIPIEQETKNHIRILTAEQLDFFPLDVSVDWINDQLYVIGEVKPRKYPGKYLIKRCNLDGSGLTVALAGLTKRPAAMEIDPCNGYLFWTVRDYSVGGIYRLDISDISNGIKHEVKVEHILREPNLGAFIVDYSNFRLFVPNQSSNTMLAVSLDGKEIKNIRQNVVKRKLEQVLSLGTVNNKFYWTDGSTVYTEEYHQGRKEYFHNKISHLGKSHYKKILINLNSSQPWPIPLNPPTHLQAVFGNKIAKAKWLPPHLLGLQGKGAWQNWSYEISVQDLTTNRTVTYKTNTTSFSIGNLTENTRYLLKVAAYTKSGQGPWSTEFKATSLEKHRNPIIIWSGSEGLFKSDAAIESVETLIHKSKMRNVEFTGMTWYEDQIYMVTNHSRVYWVNLTSNRQGKFLDLDSVGSIAVDWIAKKIYWSNLKQHLVIRSNLNGTQQEPLPIPTLAKELKIDSVQGYLYWYTEYYVECSHLNGDDKMSYESLTLFSGKQVISLTLDYDENQVYWIVRGPEGSDLYKAPMLGYNGQDHTTNKTTVAILQRPNMQGPLSYFSKRLLWLQDERTAIISDLDLRHIATVGEKTLAGLNLVYVVDRSLQKSPANLTGQQEINVTPETIDEKSVDVIGSSKLFNITWNRVKNVNYGTVFYEVLFDGMPTTNASLITTEPSVRYWRETAPFTPFNVTIRAFTYWATGSQIRTTVFSPPSTPSVPTNLRTYVSFEHNHYLDGTNNFSIRFRWDRPLFPNGKLQGYYVRSWYVKNNLEVPLCHNFTRPANQTEYILQHYLENTTYYFQVQAFTEIGSGAMSAPISVNSSQESPLPLLLIASSETIYLDDIDANHKDHLINVTNTPLKLAYLENEGKVFWINEMQELFMYNLQSMNKTKLHDLKGKPKDLTLDWLERSIYSVEGINGTFGSTVYKLNMNFLDKGNIRIYNTLKNITKLEISPMTRKMYWIETEDNQTHFVMSSNLDGSEMQAFFRASDANNKCNCAANAQVEPTFAIDHSGGDHKPKLIFINALTKDVFKSDHFGCICNVILNSTIVNQYWPLQKIKSDFGSMYWTNQDGAVFALKTGHNKLLLKRSIMANDVNIFGKHMQPYPRKECLSPKQFANFTPVVENISYFSLTLKMPEAVFEAGCMNTSTPSAKYIVKYQEVLKPDAVARYKSTFNETFDLEELKPFTQYSISAAIRNHFTENDEVKFGEPLIVKTSPGPPSKPRNISVNVLNPNLAQVNWLPPEILNGELILYKIHCLTEGSLTGLRQIGEQPVNDLKTWENNSEMLTAHLQKLYPNETYTVWVRAYSETKDTYSDSDQIQITTYPEPAAFELINRTSQTLYLTWQITPHIQEYIVEYAPITSYVWTQASSGKNLEDQVEIVVRNLIPKMQYKFRLSLRYEHYPEWYRWPSDSRFTFETLGDKPSPPGTPGIQYFGTNTYKVVWDVPQDNGAPIELYLLECLALKNYRNKRSTTSSNRTAWFYSAPSIEEEDFAWKQVYNGTENSWIITDLSDQFKYSFRVSAFNAYGWSEPSAESTEFDLSEAERLSQKNPMNLIFLATFLPISIFIIIVVCFGYVTYSRKCRKQKKIEHIIAVPRGPDVELATLRELPRRGVHSTNILYASAGPNGEDITTLPHIRRNQISIIKRLGKGAFGEVFEGKAKGLPSGGGETQVAVKTLMEGATEQEKNEFIQEAQLMSHFKHEHILQLFGVCLDNDPPLIIMELMEGGDLLKFLRNSRGGWNHTPSLTLLDLLKMCLDVAKGCKYLEEMHFVHRDLACRNCLVSSIENGNRIVKIGDFGLARDIYKNDYYKKEGEGLLPVRWMASESLLDGVFTCQSDVWAFGVLLWEIMTLGQQPYQARSNMEVLYYVRNGGRLGKPTDCPDDLYKLMLKCWEFEPDQRPTFKFCLEVLDQMHKEHLKNPTTAAHSQYISTVPDLFPDGISNAAYFLDENENSSGLSWKSDNDDENREKTPFLADQGPKEMPKYLEFPPQPPDQEELVLENDGYEIPNEMMKPEELASISAVPAETPTMDQSETENSGDKQDRVSYSNVDL